MAKILISGLVNMESSIKVGEFPINYSPIEYPFFGVSSSVSGVGYNIAKALTTLGDDASLYSLIGDDDNGEAILSRLRKENIETDHIRVNLGGQTAESVVLVDGNGKRKIYCDLKNIQDLQPFSKPDEVIDDPKSFDLAILTNINYSRPLLPFFKENGIRIASDVHVLSSLEDPYNKEFMEFSDILFLSNEACKGREGDFIKEIYDRYKNKIIVIGCGEEGALAYLGSEDRYLYEKAVAPKGVINTVGAGDALFSSFLHQYLKEEDVRKALRFAVTFAGLKIASSGGAKGFPSEEETLSYIERD